MTQLMLAMDPSQTKSGSTSLAQRSLSEVAHALGLSRQRVQQIERDALLKLRRALMPYLEELNPALYYRLTNEQSSQSLRAA